MKFSKFLNSSKILLLINFFVAQQKISLNDNIINECVDHYFDVISREGQEEIRVENIINKNQDDLKLKIQCHPKIMYSDLCQTEQKCDNF